MAQKLTTRGIPEGFLTRTLGRVTFHPVNGPERSDFFLGIPRQSALAPDVDLTGYAGILIETGAKHAISDAIKPVIRYDDISFIREGYILGIEPGTGQTRILYRPESGNNTIFSTGRCNRNCLMCSQPPVVVNDDGIVNEHLRLIALINDAPASIGITGGEPTLLGDGLVAILSALKEKFPNTHVQMLTNGRLYAYKDLVSKIGSVGHPDFTSAIPLYSDIAANHDYVVQAQGAFDQTIRGLYNAAEHGLGIEIRIVLHKQTLPRLPQLAEFIYRNLPFVDHIALMGLENMGYVKANWNLLWIDPVDYVGTLEDVVKYFFYRRMHVSIYNLQLCVLPPKLWAFARQSISDYKNIYLPECTKCDLMNRCGGLFLSSEARHSRGIKALRADLSSEAGAETFGAV